MVNERLVWYLEKNGLLAKQQCGYRANRSTVDHLVRLETFIHDVFIQNQHLVAVFFDLQKAYDATWKHGILQYLHDMGLGGNLPIFIGNFSSDRIFSSSLRNNCLIKYFTRKVFHRALSCQPLYSMSKSMILWSKLTLVLDVLSMLMTLLLCTNLPLSMLSKGKYNIISTG